MSKGAAFIGAALLGLLGLAPAAAWAQQEEVDKQIAKVISDAISSRVAARVVATQPGVGLKPPPMAAERNNIWASYSLIDIDGSFTGAPSFDSQTHSVVGGYDRDITERLIVGFAANYADTSGMSGGSYGISPYVAYRFNDTFFGIAKLNYSRSDFTGGDSDTYGGSVSLNAARAVRNIMLRGRLEVGASETDVDLSAFGGSSRSSVTNFIADGEAGYFFMPDLYGFAGLQASTANRSNSYATYARIGLEKDWRKNAAVQLKYERKIDDDTARGVNFDVNVFTITARLRF